MTAMKRNQIRMKQQTMNAKGKAACARLQMKALMQKNAAMASFHLKQISGSRYMYT